MNRTSLLASALALSACVDSGCPKGSRDVDGICMEQTSSGVTGQDDAGTDGTDDGASFAGAGEAAAGTAGKRGAAGEGTAGAAGEPDCAGAACEPPPAGCEADSDDPACACDSGFERVDGACADIDECATGAAGCDEHATCQNTSGGFTCECQPGFEGDGSTCAANPCEPRANPCDPETTNCRLEEGAAVCDCMESRGRCDDDAHACSTDLLADSENCGACEAACAGDLACVDGACEQAVVHLALGGAHSCALTDDGEILCWGIDSEGELARASNAARPLYEPTPTRIGKVKMLDVGPVAACALTLDDALVCWGSNVFNWYAPDAQTTMATVGERVINVEQLATGLMHNCVLTERIVECWGRNAGNQLGAGVDLLTFEDRNLIPIPQSVEIDSSSSFSCAVAADGKVHCWGDGAGPHVVEDAAGAPLSSVRHVALGGNTACAATAEGRALCWGDNRSGQLGNPATDAENVPHAVVVTDAGGIALSDIEQIAVGLEHVCARTAQGAVLCWGRRDRLGNGATATNAQRFATAVVGLDDVIEVAAGLNHTCVRRKSGQVQCWGDNASGQLGVPNPASNGVAYAGEPVNPIGLP